MGYFRLSDLVDVQAEKTRDADLHFFKSMDRVNRAMQETTETDQVMGDVLEEMLSLFDSDGAWFLYSRDPFAASWRMPMARTRPEYPIAFEVNSEIAMPFILSDHLSSVLAASEPVAFGSGCDHPLAKEDLEDFRIKTLMLMAVYPKSDKPWLMGMHQCSYARIWTSEEKRLFNEIGCRLGHRLGSLLKYHDLRNSEARVRGILDNIDLGVALISPDIEVLETNRRMREWFPAIGSGKGPRCNHALNGQPCREACVYCLARKTIQDGLSHEAITHESPSAGTRIYRFASSPMFDPPGQVKGVIVITEDITKNQSLESQLRQAQKMEAIGRLAGGVAHDFNNMMSVIIGHAELALGTMPPTHLLFDSIQGIIDAALRSSDLARQLLAFARKQTVAPRVLDLNNIVESMIKMLQRLIGEDIDLVWLPSPDLWPVYMDSSQIDQILANLCVNARDAIRGAGRITIETHTVTVDEACYHGRPEFHPGDFVMLAVSDDGEGMAKATQAQIFEPFFTTKVIGKGTGLGLATVYGIVKQNNGFIYVYSEPGQGSTFKIYLPRHAVESDDRPETEPVAPAHGNETILLVEDELSTLEITRLLLKKLGYRVLTASTPGEALSKVKAHAGEIHLLLTDVVMPEMDGRDLAITLTPFCPGLRCLFMSGYTGDIVVHRGMLSKDDSFIQKPFSVEDLAAKVRESLDRQH